MVVVATAGRVCVGGWLVVGEGSDKMAHHGDAVARPDDKSGQGNSGQQRVQRQSNGTIVAAAMVAPRLLDWLENEGFLTNRLGLVVDVGHRYKSSGCGCW